MSRIHPMSVGINRRDWFKWMGGVAAVNVALPTSMAQATSAYKALVCVFLSGGNDGLNTVVPIDARYGDYQRVRAGLALPQASLLPLDGVPYGLHPSLAALQPIWNAGQMTAVFNVGPLMRPFESKADFLAAYRARGQAIPPRLFSHADQQVLWQAVDGESISRSGWGGRAAQVLGAAQPVMSLGGNAHFGRSNARSAWVLPRPGAMFQIGGVQSPQWLHEVKRRAAFEALYRKQNYPSELMDVFARQEIEAMAVSDSLSGTLRTLPIDLSENDPVRDAFAALTRADGRSLKTKLAEQLFQVAKLIRQGQSTGQGAQLYFVEAAGYDTHANQLREHAALLRELGDGLAAFQRAVARLGLAESVTTFTASDFGRTVVPNSSAGTDHAWGNHHLVLGGAVRGKMTHGVYPSLELGGPDDVGEWPWERQGRWIPSTSVERYAQALLSWWGMGAAQVAAVLPNLGRFASAPALSMLDG